VILMNDPAPPKSSYIIGYVLLSPILFFRFQDSCISVPYSHGS
jgi:hypothetical protein